MRPDVDIGLEISLAVGCPVSCSYCPQSVLLKAYKGPRCFTLATFKKAIEGGHVPLTRNLTFMGHADPYLCKDATKIMRWALQERCHMGSVSTILQFCSYEDIDAVADMRSRLTDTVLHAPAADTRMKGLRIDADYVAKFKYAIEKWRNNPDFTISVFDREPHPAIHKIWKDSGIPIPCFGLHDRAGLLPDLQGPYVKHGRHQGSIPICGKQFCGSLLPNGDVSRCCNDYGLANVWGNLFDSTYYEIYHTQKFRDYIKALEDPNSECACRHCFDSYHQTNTEDRNKGYDLVGH
jgi:hypothetical protein